MRFTMLPTYLFKLRTTCLFFMQAKKVRLRLIRMSFILLVFQWHAKLFFFFHVAFSGCHRRLSASISPSVQHPPVSSQPSVVVMVVNGCACFCVFCFFLRTRLGWARRASLLGGAAAPVADSCHQLTNTSVSFLASGLQIVCLTSVVIRPFLVKVCVFDEPSSNNHLFLRLSALSLRWCSVNVSLLASTSGQLPGCPFILPAVLVSVDFHSSSL